MTTDVKYRGGAGVNGVDLNDTFFTFGLETQEGSIHPVSRVRLGDCDLFITWLKFNGRLIPHWGVFFIFKDMDMGTMNKVCRNVRTHTHTLTHHTTLPPRMISYSKLEAGTSHNMGITMALVNTGMGVCV